MKRIGLSILLISICVLCSRAQFRLSGERATTVVCHVAEEPVVQTALQLLERDYLAVFSRALRRGATGGDIVVATLGREPRALRRAAAEEADYLRGKPQAFVLKVLSRGQLLILGSDAHGTAYGILQLSRLMGVSPWEWWADATPAPRRELTLPAAYVDRQHPEVEYRGIFINDEDWGLMPWSNRHYEPSPRAGEVGPRTTERIFELMLRLRANYYWPPMHECTHPFFLTEGNREVARRYGIYLGGSHCEPMASSTAVEWGIRGQGEYDYVNNAPQVRHFWEERVNQVAGQQVLYTIGMRGVHDGKMSGAETVEEQKAVLERVIADQRELLRRYVDADVTRVPQLFIPYKEVLDVYNAGLHVPEDVTLMWCDDNYGYIRHFPTEQERARPGGNGIYYHVSYWGRPHDYLWLGTFSPALLYQQMTEAYDRGIRKVWMLNVGDIKPCEYQTELFLDMAWGIDNVRRQGVSAHLQAFLCREFGTTTGQELLPLMLEHYRLAYIRKPEFLGGTRVEEARNTDHHIVKDLPWSASYIHHRLQAYRSLSDRVEALFAHLPEERKETYFQLVKYPVQAAAQMNRKMLTAQLARHGAAVWQESTAAYDSIVALTHLYNEGLRGTGKWRGMMDHRPRKLPVFAPVQQTAAPAPLPTDRTPLYRWNAMECTAGTPHACEQLGYEGLAAQLAQGQELIFAFDACPTDSIEVELRLLPRHPVRSGGTLCLSVSLDGDAAHELSYHTRGRSEEWKQNVLGNSAVRRLRLPVAPQNKPHRLALRALDDGVVLDQVWVYAVE